MRKSLLIRNRIVFGMDTTSRGIAIGDAVEIDNYYILIQLLIFTLTIRFPRFNRKDLQTAIIYNSFTVKIGDIMYNYVLHPDTNLKSVHYRAITGTTESTVFSLVHNWGAVISTSEGVKFFGSDNFYRYKPETKVKGYLRNGIFYVVDKV